MEKIHTIPFASYLKRYMEALRRDELITNQEGKYYLIADTGYSVSNVLLTKLSHARIGSQEWAYNQKLGHTRSWVEQTFGQWVMKWRIVGKEKRAHYTPQKTRDIVIATAVLHNYELRNGVPAEFEHRDILEVIEPKNCSISEGIREAMEVIEKYI